MVWQTQTFVYKRLADTATIKITPLRRTLNSRIQSFCEEPWNLGFLEGLSSAGPYVKDSFKDSLVKDPI